MADKKIKQRRVITCTTPETELVFRTENYEIRFIYNDKGCLLDEKRTFIGNNTPADNSTNVTEVK